MNPGITNQPPLQDHTSICVKWIVAMRAYCTRSIHNPGNVITQEARRDGNPPGGQHCRWTASATTCATTSRSDNAAVPFDIGRAIGGLSRMCRNVARQLGKVSKRC
jgi:hypothetical protein